MPRTHLCQEQQVILGHHPSSSECVQQILCVPHDDRVVTVRSDSKILTTWGYGMMKMSLYYDGEKTISGVVTSMFRLPVDHPYFYILHSTQLYVPTHTNVLPSPVKIPHGFQTPWKTGSYVVQLGSACLWCIVSGT